MRRGHHRDGDAAAEAEGGAKGPNGSSAIADVQSAPVDGALRDSLELIVDRASGGAWRLVAATQGEGNLDLLVDSASGPVGVRVAPAVGGQRYYRVVGGIGYSYLMMPDEMRGAGTRLTSFTRPTPASWSSSSAAHIPSCPKWHELARRRPRLHRQSSSWRHVRR